MSCHFIHLLQVSKKCLFSLILCNFFHDLIHVYSPRAGADRPQRTKIWCQQKCLVTSFICCKFQKNLCEVWFYTIFFMILYMCIAPRQGLTTPWGRNFYVNRTSCHFGHLLQVSKKSLWSLILYNFFHDFIYVYSPRAGADSPQGTKFWCQQKGLITLPICCKFQRNFFEVWFYTIFFMI